MNVADLVTQPEIPPRARESASFTTRCLPLIYGLAASTRIDPR